MKTAIITAAVIVLALSTITFSLYRTIRPDVVATSSSTAPIRPAPSITQPPLPPHAKTIETAHYTIHSSATRDQTARVAASVEALHRAYATFFAGMPNMEKRPGKLQLVLYKDQAEFKAHNRSSPWAEAYYLSPRSHAYYSDGENPVHWMIHEATHQLNREAGQFNKVKWIDEGLAAYFGSSWIEDRTLKPGKIDPDAYPIWWLPKLELSGDLHEDLRSGKLIPLRAIVSGQGGPDINNNVNLYYIEYWSLSHFLQHYQDGKYSQRYRELITTGGTLEDFERFIGPIDHIQDEWYAYLRAVAAATIATEVRFAPKEPEAVP
jgi:hypothetical protein